MSSRTRRVFKKIANAYDLARESTLGCLQCATGIFRSASFAAPPFEVIPMKSAHENGAIPNTKVT